ncbi:MAG: FAD-binding oxidoreductase [Microcoleus sp. PH2017_15_JOR_U_A]|uniref:FAD-binding oxidoreductase n=1 Tax=Microcoleus sp. PH2017_15_JOR_U_A TaxID=2798826 RepID=UPI001D644271|nr:FAD-binding oxidoreductase [Microcoleus sp. PH2017_15_JOR_U_A]MCC3500101.1 FAD-binding oxidoreductase [Microcoleus sp. PH2017_15_JOR_U_A]
MKNISAENYVSTQELEGIVGTAGICLRQDIEAFWQERVEKAVAPGTSIACTVYPHTQEELAAVIACAGRNRWALLPTGSGSKLDWGGLVQLDSDPPQPPLTRGEQDVVKVPLFKGDLGGSPDAGGIVVVSTARLNRLVEHAVGDLTVTAEAGMKFADLQEILGKAGQFLPIDPAYPQQATLGGIVATADTGSLRHRYRGVRDLLLGITFVRSDGKIAVAGGRVVKNVAGYDLMKLLTGSYGTLGVISQVTFRVYPLPESSGTVILTGETNALAEAAQILLSSALTPTAVDLLSPQLVEKLSLGKGSGLVVRFQSIAESVKQQSARLLEVGEKLGLQGTNCGENDEDKLWQRLPETVWNSGNNSAIICKIGIRPSEAVKAINELPVQDALIHAGSGLGVLRFETATAETLLQVRRACEAKGGFMTVLAAPAHIKQGLDVWGYTGSAIDLMRRIKQEFDPENILNCDRLILKGS